MPPCEREAGPPSRFRDSHLLGTGDEPERVRGEGDSSGHTEECLIGLTPDASTERTHSLFTGSGWAAVRNSRDPPLGAFRDDLGGQLGDRLPSTARRRDSGPGGRAPGVRKGELRRIRTLGELVHDKIAAQLRIGVHDAHGEHRGCLVEQVLRCEGCGGQHEHSVDGLQAHAVCGCGGGAPGEGEHVACCLGVCENERSGHFF